jgi:class 3 adenylate cyclase/tetratricopeptide (TPR) repeat protein
VATVQTEERRIVTVLFADVVGFTTLSEHLDPESVKHLADGLFERLTAVVTEFGGRVDKLLGDGMLALFGAPVAHEDDAERAVRAALRMHPVADEYSVGSDLAAPLRLRIGINTGEVLVGTLAGTDYTAMGDVVNTASRLQSAAPPGGVLVGESTFALTSDVVRYDEPTVLQPRGRDQSVTTWLALDTVAPPGSRVRRSDLRLVGRSAELGVARSLLRLVAAERRSVLLHVIGESGVGKSRFVSEVLGSLDEVGLTDAVVLTGACAPYGESNIWAPIATALATYMGLDLEGGPETLRTEAAARAERLLGEPTGSEVDGLVEVFVHLAGYPSRLDALEPPVRRDRVHAAITRVIELRAVRGPMVLWVDDLHWADEVVIDLLSWLAIGVSRVPFVLVTAMRPGAELEWPPRVDRHTVVSLSIEPLQRAASDELARELLTSVAPEAIDERLLGALFARSGGNPLFLQEWAAAVDYDGPASELPDSLRALIASRLDQLPAAERRVLDNAAVLGVSGPIASLARFAAAMGQDFTRDTLAQLDANGLLEVDGQRWRFRSDSVREAVYQTLTKAARAQRHAGVAASYQASGFGSLDDLAHHTATAAELVADIGSVAAVPADIRVQAIGHLGSAADRARDTGSYRMVVRHTGRAIDLLDLASPAEATRRDLLRLLRAEALIELRDYQRARADLDEVLASPTATDPAVEGKVRRVLGGLLHLAGDQDGARRELGLSIDVLRGAGDDALLADALRHRGFIELFGGSLPDAEWFLGEAEAVYRRLDDERGLAYVEQHRAWLTFLGGDLELADQRLHDTAQTLQRLGDRNGVGWAYGLLAFVRFFRGEVRDAEEIATLIRSEALERGDDWSASMMQSLIANLRLWQGRLQDAVSEAEQARARFRRLGDNFGTVQALSALLRAQAALGRRAAVQRTSEELLALAKVPGAGPVPLMAVAGTAMHRGDGEAARRLVLQVRSAEALNQAAQHESSVLLAISSAQCGLFDEALVAIDELASLQGRHAFAHSVAALVHALTGAPELALREADEVMGTTGASYLDRTFATVASAAVLAHEGREDEALARLDTTLAEVLPIGDVTAVALLQLTASSVIGEPHRSGEGDRHALGAGWLTVLDALPTTGSLQ